MKKYYILLSVIVLLVASYFFYNKNLNSKEKLLSTVVYTCDDEKQIQASYYEKVNKPKQNEGEMPVPVGRVYLKFNNGNDKDLKQTISASGVRYANQDESFVFWNKGDSAIVLENNTESNYKNCIDKTKQDLSKLNKDYSSNEYKFIIKVPNTFNISEDYVYEPLPSMKIPGVKFVISEDLYKGTNLSSDTYFSVEKLKDMGSVCTGDKFLYASEPLLTQTFGNVKYSVAHSVGAGVGNRYDETVYATQKGNDCFGVRYYVHYSVIENYPVGTVKEYNAKELKNIFDAMRQTLIFN